MKKQIWLALYTLWVLPLWGGGRFYLEEAALLQNAGVYENMEIRVAMTNEITGPFNAVRDLERRLHFQVLSPVVVESELRRTEDAYYLIFKNELDYRYPLWGRGNYIIKKDLATDKMLQVKIFYQNDEGTFIRLYPKEDKQSFLELSLLGRTIYKKVTVPVSLEELALSSFARLLHLTKESIRWDSLLADRTDPSWTVVRTLADRISEDLDFLYEAEDGGMNKEGEFVFIEDGTPTGSPGGLNCSGFAKWVADGIILGWGKETLLEIEPLKAPSEQTLRQMNSWNSNYENRDPYFGLDWSRNLAVALKEAEPGGYRTSPQSLDVRSVPFMPYRQELGYDTKDIKLVLYLQAIKEPGFFYIGAVGTRFGREPELWQYPHVALFFPYFDGEGNFQIEVLETGTRSRLAYLEGRYPYSFIHLSKARATETYRSPWRPLEEGLSGIEED